MPGFATSRRTLEQAHRLMQSVGCAANEIDIRPSCEQMLREIGHGTNLFDVTFENVQGG
jgi:NAD+ synthase (glutamine-hydrolysing)